MTAGKPTVRTDAAASPAVLDGGLVPEAATGVVLVDLAALTRNYEKLRNIAGKAECAAVVKGDGYGLGAVEVARALSVAGCHTFFVATLSEAEALALSHELPNRTIYVLDGLLPGSAEDFAALGVRPVLGDLAELEEWAAFCQAREESLPAALHIDSGMNRLGLKAADQQALLKSPELLAGANVKLLMSHLACADAPENPKNEAQRRHFANFAESLPSLPRSLANSGGIFLGPEFAFDLVRPGVALFGGNPFAARPNPMEPVVHLYGRIAQIGEAAAGETVGYGAMRKLTRPTRYATVSVGYADGYLRALGSTDERDGATAYIDGDPAPILGRVSMDLTVFDVTDISEEKVQRGDFLQLLGPYFTVDDAAALAGTIGYEILTSLGPRYTRIYCGLEQERQHG